MKLRHLVLDVNGTLATDGQLTPLVHARLKELRERLQLHLLSADTHGRPADTAALLGIPAVRVNAERESEQKAEFVRNLDAGSVCAIGNGANDAGMLEEAVLGVAVLGHEGLSPAALRASDILASSIQEALDLLLKPRRLVASLRR